MTFSNDGLDIEPSLERLTSKLYTIDTSRYITSWHIKYGSRVTVEQTGFYIWVVGLFRGKNHMVLKLGFEHTKINTWNTLRWN